MHKKIQTKRAGTAPITYKEFLLSVKKPKQDGRTISGYLACFGNKDSQGDILIKGCFAKSIADRGPDSSAGNKIAFLWQHKMDEPLGRITVLKEDDYGLYFECELDDIPQASRCLKQLESGTLDKFSIGFRYDWNKMEYDEEEEAFICKELVLYEGSVVTLAANDQTYYAGLKGEELESELSQTTDELEEVISSLKTHKQYKLRQILTKYMALAGIQSPEQHKEALKEKQAVKKSRFGKIGQQITNN